MAKVREPASTQRALATLGRIPRRVPAWAVRTGGAAESALGATALATGARGPAAAVALFYLAFAAFVIASLIGSRAGECGCFGTVASDVPLRPLNAVLNGVLAAAAWRWTVGWARPVERTVVWLLAGGLAWVTPDQRSPWRRRSTSCGR